MDKRKLYRIVFKMDKTRSGSYYILSHNKSNATILAKATRIQAGLHTRVESCEEVEVIIG